jgi:CRP-like cAMP-binding protein
MPDAGYSGMPQVVIDELNHLDKAFAGNRLLATFAIEARALIEAESMVVELESGDKVLRSGEQFTSSLFPVGSTMVSLGVELSGGRTVEVASIGREGAVGGIISCGHAPAFSSAVVLVGGPALKVPIRALEEAKRRSGFVANLFCRFSDYLLAQVMQSAACNAFHTIEQRTARWLLHAQDRAGDRIELTQDALAGLLGAQRTTVNAAIRSLEDEGLISTSRGVVRVTDRAGLKHRACECYGALERHFGAVIGTGGGGEPDCE